MAKFFGKRLLAALALSGIAATAAYAADVELLNVSYDPTRELYEAYNPVFADYWKQKSGDTLKVKQSHGGSGKQARAVIDGLGADVVTLALADDINTIAKLTQKIPENWQSLPRHHLRRKQRSSGCSMPRRGSPPTHRSMNS